MSMPNSSECDTTITTSSTSSNPNLLVAQTNENIHEANKILFSDVAVKRKNRAYWWRKWRTWDLSISIGLMVHFHVMCLVYAPSTFSWDAFWVATFLTLITSLVGVSISYHRNLAHRAFNLPKWLEYFFAYCGILSFQGDPMFWVSMHRMHHQHTDKEQDPHSPTEGFWFSHINWLFDISYINQKYVRTIVTLHGTFLINSACHIWGYQSWDTGDLSKNNWIGIENDVERSEDQLSYEFVLLGVVGQNQSRPLDMLQDSEPEPICGEVGEDLKSKGAGVKDSSLR
ncbi:hypothetical protein Sjap_005315 [Stephania japonica]|uniref:Fatty acid desaturase domain-containing protein n=1 Tax=Stephania japonica TaxID=461633 RepID=A0AAP0K641_9MAGN